MIAVLAVPACALNVDVPVKGDGGEDGELDGAEDSNLDAGLDEQRDGDGGGEMDGAEDSNLDAGLDEQTDGDAREDTEPEGDGDDGWEPDVDGDTRDFDEAEDSAWEDGAQDPDDEEDTEPECGNSVVDGTEECDDGRNGDPGDGCTDDCRYSCHGDGECDDSLTCTGVETCDTMTAHRCVAGTPAGPGTPCEEDGQMCTADECDGSGGCTHAIDPGACIIAGTCRTAGEPDPGNECRECNPTVNQSGWSFRGPGAACNADGIACTDGACDGAGLCISTPSDLNCSPGDPCLPGCAIDGTGCVPPPSSMTLSCTSPVTPPAGSSCAIDLAGLANQAACLSCSSEAGMVLLDYSDFGTASCEQDGWSLVTGMNCTDSVNSCNPTNARACCSDFSTICTNLSGDNLLRSDRQLNCAGDVREWRIGKTFDTTGAGSLELCFEVGDSGATPNEGLLVYVSDGVSSSQVFCLNGEPQALVDGVLYPYCVALPSWASNNPNLQVTFVAHSNDDDDALYLDDISLQGWSTFCPPTTRIILNENFSGCPNPVTDGWNGWRVTGHPACPGSWSCPSGTSAQASWETWSLERNVDASSLDGDVTLCFSAGDNMATPGSSISVEFDAGSGYRTAWSQGGKLGNNQTCRSTCIELSAIDAAVKRNPALSIRFTFTAAIGQSLDLDDILVRKAVYCDASAVAVIGPVTETGGGSYSFTVTDPSGALIGPDILCSWDSPPSPVSDWTSISFVP